MKKKRKKLRKATDCPYCSFFKPCGDCAAKISETQKHKQPPLSTGENNNK